MRFWFLSVDVCSKRAIFHWSGYGPCHKATLRWCSPNPTSSIMSPSIISKLNTKFHITGNLRDRARNENPKKMTLQEGQEPQLVFNRFAVKVCRMMKPVALYPEQTGHSQTLVLQYLQEACHGCLSPSGPFELMLGTCALVHHEHVEECYVQCWAQILSMTFSK